MELKRDFTERAITTRDLVGFALTEIRSRYGEAGRSPRGYHNEAHTKQVIEDVGLLADLAVGTGKIIPEDKELLLIAAAYHDIEQDHGPGINEEESASIAQDVMRQTGQFSQEDEYRVTAIIRATTIITGIDPITQFVSEDYLTKIMADADLAHLGKEVNICWDSILALFMEDKAAYEKRNGSNSLTPINIIKAAESGGDFIGKHEFYTPEAESLFPHHAQNLDFVQSLAQSSTAV